MTDKLHASVDLAATRVACALSMAEGETLQPERRDICAMIDERQRYGAGSNK